MVGFFYVRKLIDSRKLSRDFADRQVKVVTYPSKGTHIHLLNRRKEVQELFDLEVSTQGSIKVEQLANQLIHSYVFYLLFDEPGALIAIVVASDNTRNKELFQVPLKEIIKIFELAAEGENSIIMNYDEMRQDYVVRKGQKTPADKSILRVPGR